MIADIRRILVAGDSTVPGITGNVTQTLGGTGSWAELCRQRLSNIPGVGPLISSGFIGCHRVLTEWTIPTGTTLVQPADAFDVYPYTQTGRWASGPSKVWTFFKPRWITANVGFAIYFIPLSGGDPQYRVDGGAWINFGQSLPDNKIGIFYVNTPINATVEIRASSDGVASTPTFPCGIEVYFLNPATVSRGFILQDISVPGTTLRGLVAAVGGTGGPGRRMAIIDDVQIGTGSPLNPKPNAGCFVQHINDYTFADVPTWRLNQLAFRQRCAPLGPVIFINEHEGNTAAYGNAAAQAAYRAQTYSSATEAIVPAQPDALVFDIFNEWASIGYPDNASYVAGGMLFDLVHESVRGHFDLAWRLYWFMRRNLIAVVPAADDAFMVGEHLLGESEVLGGSETAARVYAWFGALVAAFANRKVIATATSSTPAGATPIAVKLKNAQSVPSVNTAGYVVRVPATKVAPTTSTTSGGHRVPVASSKRASSSSSTPAGLVPALATVKRAATNAALSTGKSLAQAGGGAKTALTAVRAAGGLAAATLGSKSVSGVVASSAGLVARVVGHVFEPVKFFGALVHRVIAEPPPPPEVDLGVDSAMGIDSGSGRTRGLG